ncbi:MULTISPECIES: DUF2946 family protein [unclassified Achromobacter]|uniref:DUF2946 family protein n=1 Tax=unclassified Achromobacter TaxID=2626865 RepID=UPI000B5176C9|nr:MULTISPECIES: DUF2946 family protein [unclassified Achromobacter]OWT71372.1 hypothetical protein CEY05_24565 [Achromobacter sp. HZ34]OWT73337.1 hypothetical protein CEY04_23400 [Achromobacter sp. HZ28]
MDDAVLAAIQRWPDVPAVSGWLSLDQRGRWRLHPNGDADQGGPGESITSPAILAFIDRNYARADDGRWFFQNGPQRVYVRLDAAPYILRVNGDGSGLQTHTGLATGRISGWWLDEDGRLYADTDAGPGMLDGRDMPRVLDALFLADGKPALESLAALPLNGTLAVSYRPDLAASTPATAAAETAETADIAAATETANANKAADVADVTHATRSHIAQALGYATGC